MNEKKIFFNNSFILGLGSLISHLLKLFLLPVITSFLSPNDYGIYDLSITYILFLFPIVNCQIDISVFHYLIKNKKHNKIITNGLYLNILQFLFSIVVFTIISIFFKYKYLFLIFINIIIYIFLNTFLQISRGLNNNKVYSISNIISSLSFFILNIVFLVYLKFGVISLFISLSISNILPIIYIFIKLRLKKYIHIKYIDKKIILKLFKFSIPLIPNKLFWWVIDVSDRTIITLFMNSYYVGIYSVSSKFSSIFMNISNIFYLSWVQFITKNNSKKNLKIINDLYNMIVNINISLFLIILSSIPMVYDIFIDSSYKLSYNYIPILLLASLFQSFVGIYNGIFLSLNKTKDILKTTIYGAVINFAINVIFIKYIGLYAASISTLASFLIMAVVRNYKLKKFIKLKLDLNSLFRNCGIILITIICYFINNKYLNILIFLINLIYIFINNKMYIISLFKKIISKYIRGDNCARD